MALNLEAIRNAVIDTIRPRVDTQYVNLYPYLPLSPFLPCVGVKASTNYLTYHATFDNGPGLGGQSLVYLELHIAESGEPENAGAFVDSMLSVGDASIIQAIESDRSLGGVVDDCVCLTGHMQAINESNAGLIVGIVRLQIMTPK